MTLCENGWKSYFYKQCWSDFDKTLHPYILLPGLTSMTLFVVKRKSKQTLPWDKLVNYKTLHLHWFREHIIKYTVSKTSVILQPGLVTRGKRRETVRPAWTMFSSRSNIRWNGNTRQKVAGLTFGSGRNIWQTITWKCWLLIDRCRKIWILASVSHLPLIL